MPINKNKITKEMILKAAQCKNADELIALAKTGGIELTQEEAKAYLTEIEDFELDEENLNKIAGGMFECYMRNDCGYAFDDWK
jgi:ribosomal protein L12E/L44/L45/RPP1/RPP2